jgi:L-histidine N-alpha-methyltransferase
MTNDRFDFTDLRSSIEQESFSDHVRDGLLRDQKQLSPRFLYDERGSELFEQITHLPEYYPYDAERNILETRPEDIVSHFGEDGALIELGSGNADKTETLIREASRTRDQVHFVPVDISGDFLRASSKELLQKYENLTISAIAGTYEASLSEMPETQGSRLILFLGGSIGNYQPERARTLMRQIAERMTSGDRLMVGIDLLKDPDVIERAYNDEAGVTATFNKNILRRMNQELNASFDLDTFRHHAPFVDEKKRIEMRLVSIREQTVSIPAIDEYVHFEDGEYIHTESSHKFNPESFQDVYDHTGLRMEEILYDDSEQFAEVILGLD